jgi:hypothetical protein
MSPQQQRCVICESDAAAGALSVQSIAIVPLSHLFGKQVRYFHLNLFLLFCKHYYLLKFLEN